MNATDTDVLIVGAGPAGTAAAITLAAAGYDVTIIDKATFPRDKCCGDGLTAGALRLLEQIGLQPSDVPSWVTVDAAWVRSPSGHEVRFPMPFDGIFAAVAPRRELDDALVQRARAVGVKVHEGHAFEGFVDAGTARAFEESNETDAEETDGVITVEVAGMGRISTRFVIAADGMWSPVRKALGLSEPGYLGEWHAFRQYFSNVTGPASERLYVWFEEDLLPGYAWSFPLPGGRANVGFGIARQHGMSAQSMKTTWPDLLQRPHVRAALGPDAVGEARHLAWPIPARVDKAPLSAGRVLIVGDAACVTDPMTGEGIGQALLTGVLAAEAIISTIPSRPADVRTTYESSVRQHLLADHRMSVTLSALLRRPLLARGAIKVAGTTAWTRRNFGRWLFEDEPRAIVLTPRRWHRKFLARPGAYSTNASRPD